MRFPIIESTDLFKRSVGDQSDIVNKEMFTFESKSGKSMTLRPEGTAGCMRMAIETGLLDAGQQRLSYKGPMFRYERPQKGRSRQFQQLSLEAYGFNDCAIDLEMLEISNFLFEELSLNFSLEMSNAVIALYAFGVLSVIVLAASFHASLIIFCIFVSCLLSPSLE